ncbi:MAG: hypothetical protein WDM70_05400 [Nitrosomonadales bacterium]
MLQPLQFEYRIETAFQKLFVCAIEDISKWQNKRRIEQTHQFIALPVFTISVSLRDALMSTIKNTHRSIGHYFLFSDQSCFFILKFWEEGSYVK